ncbi:LPS export ABC transporter periplasmic protein LptC [Sulfitobacter sp. S223]|uniref:LPS export ABC transporter periplasmic protein LptC n=1 Tax=Sulfitobacter sp. S223 TaxID=2867023 RepID=UPI0021A33149|nr:LPS export ABC transporter periplasmic protein LptC [Sulfitobacter sp. S223]UWR26448.1 LPS export ABC transporter periplasmic protein LptC [Sulfitobacter sp. S223]
MVALLKVAFPLAALALLSTLFLLSRALDTDTPIPFADVEIQERLRDQQITGPFFSGATTGGDQMSFSAEKLVTLPGRVGGNRAENVLATLEAVDGATFKLQADVAELDIGANTAVLNGDVIMDTSTGYHINTARLTAMISDLDVATDGEVLASGPLGELTAGKMRVFKPNPTDSTQMLFSDGVKLVYTPN